MNDDVGRAATAMMAARGVPEEAIAACLRVPLARVLRWLMEGGGDGGH